MGIVKKLGKDSQYLANNVADMSARIDCDLRLQKVTRKACDKKTKKKCSLIAFACRVKQRER